MQSPMIETNLITMFFTTEEGFVPNFLTRRYQTPDSNIIQASSY